VLIFIMLEVFYNMGIFRIKVLNDDFDEERYAKRLAHIYKKDKMLD